MYKNENKTTNWKIALIVGLAVSVLTIAVVSVETKKSVLAQGTPSTFRSPEARGRRTGAGGGTWR